MDPNFLTTRQALDDGLTERELRRARTEQRLVRIRRGAYLRGEDFTQLDAVAQHRALARATAHASNPDAVLSHVSAAALHGLALWAVPLNKAHLTVNRAYGAKTARRRVLHATSFDDSEWVLVGECRATSVARTVVDLARSVDFERAVCVGDNALARKLVTFDELRVAVDSAHHRRGAPAARRAVTFMTDRSESVGESRSRVLMKEAGLPMPLLNQWVFTPDGRCLGRVDFLFPDTGVIGEFDGEGKYSEFLRPGQTPRDVALAEKYREDRMRELGWMFARWNWRELSTPEVIARRLRDTFERSTRSPLGSWSDSSNYGSTHPRPTDHTG
ncbi:MAG: type IV toxin-antitoxin system AbiEi family antitoxin domain-containing protein [Rhodococcus sp. (in: high G+C Gram-positive bacteria)]